MIVDGFARAIGNDGGFPGVEGLTWALAAGGNVFLKLPSQPNRAVAVFPSGGFEADSKLPYSRPTLQVFVRGDEDAMWALEMWQKIYARVQGMRNVTLPDGTYLVSCLAMQSGPVYVGQDANGRYQFSLNLMLEIRDPTTERTL